MRELVVARGMRRRDRRRHVSRPAPGAGRHLLALAVAVVLGGAAAITGPATILSSPAGPVASIPAAPLESAVLPATSVSVPTGQAPGATGADEDPPASSAPVPRASTARDGAAAATPAVGSPAVRSPETATSAAATPAAATPAPRLPRIPAGAVPALYYHRVQAVPSEWKTWDKQRRVSFIRYIVTPAAFEAQLDWLVANGYTTILPRDLAAHWDEGRKLPKRPVIITFDDGTPDWVNVVLPMLRERGMVAQFYLTLDAIEVGALSWADVRRLAKAGNGIGAHGVDHVQLANLGPSRPPASEAAMWYQVKRARDVIAREVGVAPDSMAYVGGGFNETLVRLVRKAGYTTARSIVRGIEQRRADRFALRVVRIGPRDDVADMVEGTLVPGLPTFTARMHGVSDRS